MCIDLEDVKKLGIKETMRKAGYITLEEAGEKWGLNYISINNLRTRNPKIREEGIWFGHFVTFVPEDMDDPSCIATKKRRLKAKK